MTRLQKAAWFNLAGITVVGMIGTAAILYLTKTNARGIEYVLICIFVPVFVSPGLYIHHRKKSLEVRFDEREKMIHRRAFAMAAIGLTIFLACVCIFPFFVLGGQSVVKVYYLPVIFFGALFTAQFIHSAAVLVMCALEDDHG